MNYVTVRMGFSDSIDAEVWADGIPKGESYEDMPVPDSLNIVEDPDPENRYEEPYTGALPEDQG